MLQSGDEQPLISAATKQKRNASQSIEIGPMLAASVRRVCGYLPMAKVCIYCKSTLTSTTRKAHVWPASMGGRLAPRDTNCDACNNAMSPLEDHLRESLSHSFASVGAVNDDRDPIAVTLEFAGREFVFADGNAVMQVGGRRFERESKSMVVPLPAGLEKQAEVLAKAMHSHGLGVDDVDRLNLAPGDPEPALPIGPTRNEHHLKLGGPIEHKRVFVKMALELLAFHRHDLAMRGELSEARRFARDGTGTFRSKPDTRSAGSGLFASISLPEVFNSIEVWSHGRAVFFRVVFLGPLVFTGTLATVWCGDPFRAIYAFDARDPAPPIASLFEACDGPNLAVWFEGMVEETVAQAVSALGAISLRLAQSKAPVVRELPPDLNKLRSAVKERLASMPVRRTRARATKKSGSDPI